VAFGRGSHVIAVAVTLLASRALAQEPTAIERLVQMNQKALADYDSLDFSSARKTLVDALLVGKKAQVGAHPLMARTFVNLGAVYLTGFKNRDQAIESFSRALEIDPVVQLTQRTATQEVKDAFAAAKRARAAPRRAALPAWDPADDVDEKDLPVRISALDCPNEDEAIIDRPVTLRCAVAPNLPVAKVFLIYRERNKDRYTEVPMVRSPKGWHVGKIPKKAMVGKAAMYYFEGRNASGKTIVRNGDADSPNILLLMDEDAYKEMKRSGPQRFEIID
jgi:tetratricopeptide (TPR) repeat protein